MEAIRRAPGLEQALLGLLVSLFALVLGGIIAWGLLEYRLELEMDGVWWTMVTSTQPFRLGLAALTVTFIKASAVPVHLPLSGRTMAFDSGENCVAGCSVI